MNPISALFRSRKFLLLMLDTIVSLVLFFVGQYAPDYKDAIITLIGILQPVFVAVIVGIAVEDSAAKLSNGQ